MPTYHWLPPLLLLADHNGDWAVYLDATYAIFKRDFVESSPGFRGTALGLKRLPLVEGREATFWHLISKGPDEASRVADVERCERIPWPRPVIENEAEPTIKVWEEHRKGGEYRIHIWVEPEDYVVVLARRRTGQPDEYLLPWTAYRVETGHYRRNLQRRFERS